MTIMSLTAVIHAKSGSEELIRKALLDVGDFVEKQEPGTLSYYVTAGEDTGVFVTHERYRDRAALDAHNDGAGSKAFFAAAEGHIEKVEVVIGEELAG